MRKIKTGDNVKVLSGKDRGKTGKVVQVLFKRTTDQYYVVVEGVNILKRHMKTRQRGQKGQVIELPAPIHMSNVMLIDPTTNKPARIGFAVKGDKKQRINKKTNEVID